MRTLRRLVPFLVLPLVGCSGLDVDVRPELRPGRVVAVLPVQGDAPGADREVLRSMIQAQLSVRNVAVLDGRWVDHVLARAGHLQDPDRFQVSPAGLREIARLLDVDGVVVGRDFGYERLNLLVAYRRGLRGELAWYTNDGTPYWRARYTARAPRGRGDRERTGAERVARHGRGERQSRAPAARRGLDGHRDGGAAGVPE